MSAGKLVKWSQYLLCWCSIYMEGVTIWSLSALFSASISNRKSYPFSLMLLVVVGLDGDQAKWNQGVFIIQYAGEI